MTPEYMHQYLELLRPCLNAASESDESELNKRFMPLYQFLTGDRNRGDAEQQGRGLLLNYIAYKLGRNAGLDQAENLLNDTLMSFYTLILNRPEIAKLIKGKIAGLQPPLDELYERRVRNWGGNLGGWVDDAMVFSVVQAGSPQENGRDQAKAINDRRDELADQGYSLLSWLDTVPQDEGQEMSEDAPTDSLSSDETEFDEFEEAGPGDHAARRKRIDKLVKALAKILDTQGAEAADAQLEGQPGSARFAVDSVDVIKLSNKIKIPLISLLYWKAERLVWDWQRSRKSRLAMSESMPHTPDEGDSGETDASLDAEDETSDETRPSRLAHEVSFASTEGEAIEDGLEGEDESANRLAREDLFEHIEKLLLADIKHAEAKLNSAQGKQARDRAQAQLEKQRRLHRQHRNLFELMWLGYTEKEIGAVMDLTRDQVRTLKAHLQSILAPLQQGEHA